jgi:ABC-type glycerol-3-phosphate transport system permease component
MLYHASMLDTYAGLLLPGIAPAFGIFLFRQATMRLVPNELLEAAGMDACVEVRAFFVIGFPLLRPMINAFMLITFVM